MSSRALVAVWFVLMVTATAVLAWALEADPPRVLQWWLWGTAGVMIGKVWGKA